jgi:hypothetical protein
VVIAELKIAPTAHQILTNYLCLRSETDLIHDESFIAQSYASHTPLTTSVVTNPSAATTMLSAPLDLEKWSRDAALAIHA